MGRQTGGETERKKGEHRKRSQKFTVKGEKEKEKGFLGGLIPRYKGWMNN